MDSSMRQTIICNLKNAPAILANLINHTPSQRLKWSPRISIWTIKEHVHHLAMAQMMLSKRIKLFMTNEHPVIAPFTPEGDDAPTPSSKSIDKLLAVFERFRVIQVKDLTDAEETVWSRTADHPEYIEYDFSILARHIMVHDYFHMHRIEELAFMQEDLIQDL